MMTEQKFGDPVGKAILDFAKTKKPDDIIVSSDICEDDIIPIEVLFRNEDEMPELEIVALNEASGKILDVGAGAGAHASFLKNLGKDVTTKELKNPKSSEFKKMTGPFWEAIKLSPEVSILLDDQIEKMFIDQVILPKLNNPGSESEELPNMDELLGAWLNNMGLIDKADIHFKGTSGDL